MTRILFVNDNARTRTSWADYAGMVAKADIETAATPETTMRLLNNERYDCVIVDGNLRTDVRTAAAAMELVRSIRKENRDIPLYVVGGDPQGAFDASLRQRAEAAGATGYIPHRDFLRALPPILRRYDA